MSAVLEEKKTSHRVDIVPVRLEKHPNADSLSIIKVYGWTCVGRTSDWEGRKWAAYIPPDSTVDVRRPEFSFLASDAKADERARIKAKKLRGIVSFGLLVPAPEGSHEGDDVSELLDVRHYEPPAEHEKGNAKFFMGGEVASGPNVVSPKYDLDNLRSLQKYDNLFLPNEPVVLTEKLDGSNARYVFHNGMMYCGSRTEWKKEYPSYDHLSVAYLVERGMPEEKAVKVMDNLLSKPKRQNLWWQILRQTPELERYCQDHPDTVVYGEVFGNTNCIKYGLDEGNRFAAFDLYRGGNWVPFYQAYEEASRNHLPWVPVFPGSHGFYREYDFDMVCELAEGGTLVPGAKEGTIREGVVITPWQEHWHERVGRVKAKVVSPTFLEKYH